MSLKRTWLAIAGITASAIAYAPVQHFRQVGALKDMNGAATELIKSTQRLSGQIEAGKTPQKNDCDRLLNAKVTIDSSIAVVEETNRTFVTIGTLKPEVYVRIQDGLRQVKEGTEGPPARQAMLSCLAAHYPVPTPNS